MRTCCFTDASGRVGEVESGVDGSLFFFFRTFVFRGWYTLVWLGLFVCRFLLFSFLFSGFWHQIDLLSSPWHDPLCTRGNSLSRAH